MVIQSAPVLQIFKNSGSRISTKAMCLGLVKKISGRSEIHRMLLLGLLIRKTANLHATMKETVMSGQTVGLLHPGEMGVSIGAAVKTGGHEVAWVSRERGPATRERASTAGFTEREELTGLLEAAEVVISVCPPHAATALATQVASHGYTGIYMDANAISPQTSRQIGVIVGEGGAHFVDAGIIGPPATKAGVCRLYLSGARERATSNRCLLEVLFMPGLLPTNRDRHRRSKWPTPPGPKAAMHSYWPFGLWRHAKVSIRH